MNGSGSQSAPEQHLKARRKDLREAFGPWQICSVTVIAAKKNEGLDPELWCYQFFLSTGFRELWIHFSKYIRRGENDSGCAFEHNVITTIYIRKLGQV